MTRGTQKKGSAPLLRMENLSSLAHGGRRLQNLRFDLRPGETHVLLGTYIYDHRNFCDLLCGDVLGLSGAYDILGQPYKKRRRLEREIQFIGLAPMLCPSISVAENILIASLKPRFCVKRGALDQCTELMRRVGVSLDLSKSPSQMSVDECKTVEMLRLCAIAPPVAVFFDAINYLGGESRGLLPKVLRFLTEAGCGVIYMTSSFEEALRLGDRISILDGGTIKGTFPTEEVRKNPSEIAYLLSGWEPLIESRTEEDDLSVLQAISNIDDIMQSDGELKRVLEHIAGDLVKALGADCSVLYLVDESRMNVVDVISSGDGAPPLPLLPHTDVLALLQQKGVLQFRAGEARFEALFSKSDAIRHIFCYPVRLDGKKNALIQVMFSAGRVPAPQAPIYLKMYAREVAVAIETSRLMGNSVLLQETHHRIKNNLQMVHNLLYLQKADALAAPDPNVGEILDEAMHRIKCIATVHALLCKDWFGRNVVNLKTLILEILHIYHGLSITLDTQLEETSVPYDDAISIALVTNELISNCVRHAFLPGQSGCRVRITLRNTGTMVILSVADNGAGLPEGFQADAAESVGMSIITSILRELNGALTYLPASPHGTEANVRFPRRASLSPLPLDNGAATV